MSFKSQHPEYKGYISDELFVSELPREIGSALQGFIIRHCKDERELKVIINDIASRVPMEVTQNWGWNYLVEDLPHYVGKLTALALHKVMEFLEETCTNNNLSFSVDDVNELLEDLKIGYILEADGWSGRTTWLLRENVASRVESIDATTKHLKDICEQTLDHLKQAKEHLLNTQTDRDRKDAVRDCMSAMESLLKTLSGKSDIKDATKVLRATSVWGPDTIVKDGLSIWDRLHAEYPDIRHGQPVKSALTDEEALYWLERITCFIRYLSRVKNR